MALWGRREHHYKTKLLLEFHTVQWEKLCKIYFNMHLLRVVLNIDKPFSILHQDPVSNGEVKPEATPAKDVMVDGHSKSD